MASQTPVHTRKEKKLGEIAVAWRGANTPAARVAAQAENEASALRPDPGELRSRQQGPLVSDSALQLSEGGLREVIRGDFCVGCGACAFGSADIAMRFTELGSFLPSIEGASVGELSLASRICPFSNDSMNEDTVAALIYPEAPRQDQYLGRFIQTYVGYVAEREFRLRGSSGGMGSWILVEALNAGLVDHVVHVKPTDPNLEGGLLFRYGISSGPAEVIEGAKSRYYPVEMSAVLDRVRETPGRYAIVGVPCFVRAIRNLAHNDPVIRDRIVLTVALFCGHLKSSGFGESLAWQLGISPQQIAGLDFRHKLYDRPASAYALAAYTPDQSQPVVRPMSDLIGRDWGMGLFKLNACDFCDDVSGELADISVGDAWLPGYVGDSGGTNVVVVRDRRVDDLITAAIAAGRLHMDPIDSTEVYASQLSGFKHRRQGLAYRLWQKDRAGKWRPKKRVTARRDHLRVTERLVQRLRQILPVKSRRSFLRARQQNDLSIFLREMRLWIRLYRYSVRLDRRLMKAGRSLRTKLASFR